MSDDPGGWSTSAEAWIAAQGESGDRGRRLILDGPMLARVRQAAPRTALDVGCGEGRFCRMLSADGIDATGIDPTPALLAEARRRDPDGRYIEAAAEALPFGDASFDLTVSYLTLIDIEDIAAAIAEMARVTRPGGRILVANLTGLITANPNFGWIDGPDGKRLFAIDHYLEERPNRAEWDGISVINWHRPLSTYMAHFLAAGLTLTHFDEPAPTAGDPAWIDIAVRAPWFLVMEWQKPEAPR